MGKAIIVYNTMFGNTEKIARALADGIEKQGVSVDCLKVDKVDVNKLSEYDFLAIGGPTHAFGLSKLMKDFLQKLERVNLAGKRAFAFDTKVKFRFAGSAAKKIEEKLKKLGMEIVKSHVSAVVKGRKGPLEEGAEETFRQIGIEIAKSLQ
jgi:flavorubredoxin